MSATVAALSSPYKGLAPFDDSDLDALLFFGRERESEVIAANLMATRVTVLYGPSGVGKTSVLRAGVAYRLRQEDGVEVVVFSSWPGDPVAALIEAVGGDDQGSLVDALAAAANRAGGDLYLVLDQFEEYFLYHEGDRALAEALAEAVRRPGLRVHFLIGIREEALALLDAFKATIPNLLGNRLRLQRLDRVAGEDAIVGPVRRYNELRPGDAPMSLEPELVTTVLDEVVTGRVELGGLRRPLASDDSDVGRIEAPYLQLVMARLWELETGRGSRTLRLQTLQELGGAVQIVEDHLEHAMGELSPREKDVAAEMYRFLVTPSGTKIAHDVRDLAGYAEVDEGEADTVLRRLSAERIVRSDSTNGGPSRYEIYHDVLADAVVAWRNRHDAERALRDAERRRRRAFAVATAALIALVLVAAIAVYALAERSRSRTQAQRAHARELAARATGQLDTDPQGSVALAAQAARLEGGRYEEDVLRNALLAANQRAVMRADGPVRVARFDPNGARIATASADGKVRIYRVGRRQPERVLDLGSPVTTLHYSRDGELLLAGARSGNVRIWSTRGARNLQAGGAVAEALFARGHELVVTLARTGVIRVWNAGDGKLIRSFRVTGAGLPRAAAVSPGGGLLVVVGRDRFARMYSLLTGLLVSRLAHGGRVHCAAFVPGRPFFVTCDHAGFVRVWSTVSGRQVRRLRGAGPTSAVVDAAVSPNGVLVAGAVTDGTARVWEVPTGFQSGIAIGHSNPVSKVAFSPTGSAIATASTDDSARTWLKNGRPIAVLVGHRDRINSVDFSPDGRYVVTASDDGTARLWRSATEPDLVLLVRQDPITAFAVSPDGRRMIAGDAHGVARVRKIPGRGVMSTLHVRGPVTAVAFGAAGRPLVTARPFSSIAFATSTGAIARGRFDGTITVTPPGRPGFVLRAGERPLTALAFSPDGSTLFSGDAAGAIMRWDLASRRRTAEARHRLGITSLVVRRFVLSASRDGEARLWAATTLRPLSEGIRWHFGPIASAALDAESRWIVTAGPTAAGVGPASTRRLLLRLKSGSTRPLLAAAFAGADHRLILTAGRDGQIRYYRCEICGGLDDLLALAGRRLASGS